jgi:hypothetical protein
MSSPYISSETNGRDDSCLVPAGLPSEEDLSLFRFGLRQLLLFFVLASVVLAAVALSRGPTALMLLLMATIVALHVLATAIGSRLRERADRRRAVEMPEDDLLSTIALTAQRSERLAAVQSAPRSPWHLRGTTVLPWLRRLVAVAIVLGGIVGASYLAVTIGHRTSPAGVVVGGVSVAVLCGWIAFIFGSFFGVFRHGFREAVAERRKDSNF